MSIDICDRLHTCDLPITAQTAFRYTILNNSGCPVINTSTQVPTSQSLLPCAEVETLETILLHIITSGYQVKVFDVAGSATARILCNNMPTLKTLIQEVYRKDQNGCGFINVHNDGGIITGDPCGDDCTTPENLMEKIMDTFVQVGTDTAIRIYNYDEAVLASWYDCDKVMGIQDLLNHLLVKLDTGWAWLMMGAGGAPINFTQQTHSAYYTEFNPIDGASYHIHQVGVGLWTAMAQWERANAKWGKAMTLVAATINTKVGTAGTAEPSTLSIDDSNDNVIVELSADIDMSQTAQCYEWAGEVAIDPDQPYRLMWDTPIWVTNPLGVYLSATLIFKME